MDEQPEQLPARTRDEIALDILTVVTSAVPWLGGPVGAILSGISTDRKIGRVREILEGVAQDLRDLESEASKRYVQREEFGELLEKVLKQAAKERATAKRQLYRRFLGEAIRQSAKYDDQLELLRTIEALQPEHLRVLAAIAQDTLPEPPMYAGAPIQTLERRLGGSAAVDITEAVRRLNDLRVTNLQSLQTIMTGRGAEDLQSTITPFGRRLVRLLTGEARS